MKAKRKSQSNRVVRSSAWLGAILFACGCSCDVADGANALQLLSHVRLSDTSGRNKLCEMEVMNDIGVEWRKSRASSGLLTYVFGKLPLPIPAIKRRLQRNLSEMPPVIKLSIQVGEGQGGKATERDTSEADKGDKNFRGHILIPALIGYALGLLICLPIVWRLMTPNDPSSPTRERKP